MLRYPLYVQFILSVRIMDMLIIVNLESLDAALKGFEFARDISTQLITLSLGVFVATITFTKALLPNITGRLVALIGCSWTFYFISIFFGIWHMMALTGHLTIENIKEFGLVIQDSAKLPFVLQVFAFMIATILMLIYGIKVLRNNKPQATETNCQ